jgi:hypothetical protein
VVEAALWALSIAFFGFRVLEFLSSRKKASAAGRPSDFFYSSLRIFSASDLGFPLQFAPGGGGETAHEALQEIFVVVEIKVAIDLNTVANDRANEINGVISTAA